MKVDCTSLTCDLNSSSTGCWIWKYTCILFLTINWEREKVCLRLIPRWEWEWERGEKKTTQIQLREDRKNVRRDNKNNITQEDNRRKDLERCMKEMRYPSSFLSSSSSSSGVLLILLFFPLLSSCLLSFSFISFSNSFNSLSSRSSLLIFLLQIKMHW